MFAPGAPWWVNVIGSMLFWLFMGLAMNWLARSRHRPCADVAGNVLRYPRSILMLGLAVAGLFLLLSCLMIAIVATDRHDPRGAAFGLVVFLTFATLGAWLIAEYALVRFDIETDGVRYRTAVGRQGFLRWSEITRVRYSTVNRWLRIEGPRGEVVRVSALLTGLPALADALLIAAEFAVIDDDARVVLSDAARGVLPPLVNE